MFNNSQQQPLVTVSSAARQHSGRGNQGDGESSPSSASVAAARRRFAASTVYENHEDNVHNNSSIDEDTRSRASGYDNYTKTSARSNNTTVSTFGNSSITVATPRAVNSSNATRLRASAGGNKKTQHNNSNFANATNKSHVPSNQLSSRDSTQNLYGSSSSPTRWTTNLYREFRPNTINRCVDSFEKSLTTLSVETRLHALRSLYHNACNGAAHRRAIRQRLPKLVGAVAAICNEADPTRPGGNRLHDVAFRLIAAMLGDGERATHEEATAHTINGEDVIEGERFDNSVVLEESLMSVAASRALLAGGDATFAVATCLRRISELPSVAHAIVHNDVLLESILRVLEEESIWHLEVSNNNDASVLHPKRSISGTTTYSNRSESQQNNNMNMRSQSNASASSSSPTGENNNNNNISQASAASSLAMSLEGAAAVIQLRICLLNICSRPSAATYLLSRSQRFMSLMQRDGKMGVMASRDLSLQLSEQQRLEMKYGVGNTNSTTAGGTAGNINNNNTSSSSYTLSETLLLNAEQRHNVKSFNIGGALLEEKPEADLANGKRLLFQPSHIVTFALTGAVFDSAAASTSALSTLPSHPSVPSEGGSSIPFSRASHRQDQPLQCRLEACRIVRGDELSLLAATSAVLALHTLHSIAMREGASTSSPSRSTPRDYSANNNNGGGGEFDMMMRPASMQQKELVKCLSSLIQQKELVSTMMGSSSPSKNANTRKSGDQHHKVDPVAIQIVLQSLKSAATLALDVFEESDSENILRKLENFSSEGRAMLDKLRSNLYYGNNSSNNQDGEEEDDEQQYL